MEESARQGLKAASVQAPSVELLRRRLLSGGTWAFGGRILLALAGLISSVLLARLLTPQALGTYFLAYSILSVGTALGALGLTETVVRLVAQGMGLNLFGRVRRVISVALGVGTLGALGVGLAYLLVGGDLATFAFDAPALAAITGLLAGWIIVETLQSLVGETFRGLHDVRLATVLGGRTSGGASTGVAAVVLLTALLFLFWLVYGQATLATVVLLAICSGAATTLLAGCLLYRKVARLPLQTPEEPRRWESRKLLGEMLSISLPLLVVSLVGIVRINGDVWIMGAFLPQRDLALYGAALRLASMVTLPMGIVTAIAPPLIAEMYSQGQRGNLERVLRSTATLAGIPAWLASIGCIFFAGPILSIVYGNYYREGAIVLILLSIGLFASVCAGSSGMVLAYTGHQKTLMVITIASSAATLVAMLATVEPYGIVGVAICRMGSQILQNGITLLVVKQKTGMWTHVGFRGISQPWNISR